MNGWGLGGLGTAVAFIGSIVGLPGCGPSSDASIDDEDDEDDGDDQGDDDDDDDASSPGSCADHEFPPSPDCNATDLLGRLACVRGVEVVDDEVTDDGHLVEFVYEQPLDHGGGTNAVFSQRLLLRHVDHAAPMVLKSSGYALAKATHELAALFGTNVLSVEHRYFGRSTPEEPKPWQYLTIEQAAGDFHRVVEALAWIYPGPWINSGASKGGEAAVFHRRLYPCDVEATVAYVAPVVYGTADSRFVPFLRDVGGDSLADCRQRLREAQREALLRREAMIARMSATDHSAVGGVEIAFEHAVIRTYFVFFQYHDVSECEEIPSPQTDDLLLFEFVKDGITSVQNAAVWDYGPYYVQAATQLGAPAGYLEHLIDLLEYPESYVLDSYVPPDATPTFDAAVMPSVQDWVARRGERLLFIDGEFDPWRAAAYDLGSAIDSYSYVAPRSNHGASIGELAAADRDAAMATLERWFGSKRIREHVGRDPDWRVERRY